MITTFNSGFDKVLERLNTISTDVQQTRKDVQGMALLEERLNRLEKRVETLE